MSIRHAFHSTKPDSTDTSIVSSSEWNDDHVVTGLAPLIPASDFVPAPNGINDNTTGLQAWLDELVSTQQVGYLDPGSYVISSQLNIDGGVTIIGGGRDISQITLSSPTQVGIAINTDESVNFSGFTMQGDQSASAGALIVIDGPAVNESSIFSYMTFFYGYDQIRFDNAGGTIIDGCRFIEPTHVGLSVLNATNPDFGDWAAISNFFVGTGTGIGIFQAAGGGGRIIGNAFQRGAYGYSLSLASGVSTSELVFSANTLSANTVCGVSLRRGSGTSFGSASITGNMIGGAPTCVELGNSAEAAFLLDVNVTGNYLAPVAGTGVNVGRCTGFVVTGNEINGSGTGVLVSSVSQYGCIGLNNYLNVTTIVNNGSSSTTNYDVGGGGLGPVSSLPSAVLVGVGTRTIVSDSTSVVFGNVVAGSGANKVPVYSDGTNWRIG